MMTMRHLTEAERQGAADGTLDAESSRDVAEHMATCDACAADVGRLRTLMTRIRVPGSPEATDDLWPAIRSRIEEAKVVPLDSAPASRAARRRSPWIGIAVGIAALIFVVAAPQFRFLRAKAAELSPAPSDPTLINVSDSSNAYEQEATTLLNELQMQRAMMPPQTNAVIDHDLRVVDQAIAEVKDALVRDPNNPALRRLLASSYRQKVELLKRATNAG